MTTDNSGMPPLPDHPAIEYWDDWTDAERDAMLAYGRQVAQMCAELCEQGDHVDMHAPPMFEHCVMHVAEPSLNLSAAIRKRFNLEKP